MNPWLTLHGEKPQRIAQSGAPTLLFKSPIVRQDEQDVRLPGQQRIAVVDESLLQRRSPAPPVFQTRSWWTTDGFVGDDQKPGQYRGTVSTMPGKRYLKENAYLSTRAF